MKEFVFGVGRFVAKEFDKILLVGILMATLFRAVNGADLAKDIAMESFAALVGFMQGRNTKPPQA